MKGLAFLALVTAAAAVPQTPPAPPPAPVPDHHHHGARPVLDRRHGPDEDDDHGPPPPKLGANPSAPKDGAQIGSGSKKTTTPPGCRQIASDTTWPSAAEWKKALPGVIPREANLKKGVYRPDYAVQPKTVKEVQDAVVFAAKHNIRLSVIASGHDWQGRNDAPTGLLIDVSQLKGVRGDTSFTPTKQGAPPPVGAPNTITPVPGKQPVYTFGAGVTTQELHNVASKSKLVTVGAAHGSVTVAGGWGQAGGHGPISNLYGLGVDQFLEFKVVTADGQVKVANKVENPDLFWALRGGGGGTWGVVVQATVKAHPDIPMVLTQFTVSNSAFNSSSVFEGFALFQRGFEELVEKRGAAGYYYLESNAVRGVLLNHGEKHATAENARQCYEPLVKRIAALPGMKISVPLTSKEFPNYKGYFDYRFGSIDGKKTKREPDTWSLLNARAPVKLTKPQQIAPLDSRLLGLADLASPNLTEYVRQSAPFVRSRLFPTGLNGHLVGGGKVFKPEDDTSVHPAWRKAYTHVIGYQIRSAKISVQGLRDLSPGMGSYINEATPFEDNWKETFWGPNYARLSKIKTKYDPKNVFWVTPAVNADLLEVRDNRVCEVSEAGKKRKLAPATDNLNVEWFV